MFKILPWYLKTKSELLRGYYRNFKYKGIRMFVFGYPAYYDNELEKWKWLDNNTEIVDPIDRACPKCKQYITEEGHDPCITNLPGVEFACCGHGKVPGYVKLYSGKKMFLEEYLQYQKLSKQ